MKRHALFVGVDQYADGHIPNLSCAVSDATDLHGFFKYGAGYDRVELLPNPAGKKEVLGMVRELTADLGPGDFFLFFFAGHGFRVGENHVLVCAKDLYDDVKYEYDGLPLGQLKHRLSGAFDSALLLDACQSDILATRGGEGIAERDLSLIHAAPTGGPGCGALTIVTSCDAGQTAAELSERRHGLFTVAMLDLLNEAKMAQARIDLSDAFRMSLGRRMGEIAARFGLPTEQRPRFSCTGNSCFVLLDGIASAPEQSEGDSDAATEWVPRDEEKRKSCDFIREAAAGIEGSNAFPHVLLGDDCLIDYAISSETSALLLEVLPFSCDYGVVDEDASPASDEVSLAFVAKLLKAKAFLGKQSDAHVSIGVFASQATIQDIRSMIADSKFKDVHLEYLTCANFTTQVKRVLNDQQAGEQDERQDDVHGICEQATNYYRGLNGVKEDHARAVELYKIAAARGDVTAQTIVGVAYYNGDGVAQDYAEAVKWLRKAAERGSVQAQCLLGACYKQGEGVSQDNREAVRWFRLAAEKGDAQSQRCLGMCYQAGEGVLQDHAAAVKWFRSAAEQGDVKAECFLAACYVSGKGVSRDFDEAEKWACKAVDQGDANAIKMLALIRLIRENDQDDETEDDSY